MGKRTRQDPNGHAQRGKGTATPTREEAENAGGPVAVPGPRTVLFLDGASTHYHKPETVISGITEALTELRVRSGDTTISIFYPATMTSDIADVVTKGGEAPPETKTGLVLPDGSAATNPDAIAKANANLKGATA